MNSEWKAKWIAALRSGKYTQAKGSLKNGGGHCCLGVLCDITKMKWMSCSIPNSKDAYMCLDNAYDLPKKVMDMVGLEQNNPTVEVEVDDETLDTISLAEFNDASHSFKEIANLIEAQF